MNRQVALTLTAFAVTLAGAQAKAQNLLTNGNLDVTYQQLVIDNAPAGPGMEDFFAPKPAGWINEGFRTIAGPFEDEMSSEPWAGPAPTPVTNNGVDPDGPGGNPGDWAVFFKPFTGGPTNGPATGHLYQDVPATPGQQYKLTGWAGVETNALMQGAEFSLDFLNGGGGLIGSGTLNLLPTLFVDNGEPFDYKQYTVSATAPAGTVAVRARASMIDATGNPAGGGQAYVVDDFVLTVIPEPSSAALAVCGLLALRRRRI